MPAVRLSMRKIMGTLPFSDDFCKVSSMPRVARTVFAGLPHHITQRGNRRENVFFTEEDREVYLEWLREYCRRREVGILAYGLMTNHIHLVAVPGRGDNLPLRAKESEPRARSPG